MQDTAVEEEIPSWEDKKGRVTFHCILFIFLILYHFPTNYNLDNNKIIWK